jgi:hypothetical protein
LNGLDEIVATMQGQLNALLAHVKMSDERTSQNINDTGSDMNAQRRPSDTNPSSGEAVALRFVEPVKRVSPSLPRRPTNSFCGPTSPEYSLNAAQRRMQSDRTSGPGSASAISPSVDTDHSDDGNDQPYSPETDYALPFNQPNKQVLQPSLLEFRNSLPKDEAVRILLIYHSMMGDLHPICDIERMVQQVDACYTRPISELGLPGPQGSAISENDLLIINLALTIALCTETGPLSETGRTIYENCRDVIQTRLASLTTDIKHVYVVFLVVSEPWTTRNLTLQ